jgi:hypothetical protein
MRVIQDTTDRLVLEGASPLFRPFFLGGLGLFVLGVSLLVGGPLYRLSTVRSPSEADNETPIAGPGAFLATFGFFVAIVPVIGRFPYRREIVVDRAAGQLVRRDRTLLRLRQESYTADEVRAVEVDEARHVDGDPYFTLMLLLESGQSVTLDRFTDRTEAGAVARLIRDHLGSRTSPETDRPESRER